jgi:hypothetical protein
MSEMSEMSEMIEFLKARLDKREQRILAVIAYLDGVLRVSGLPAGVGRCVTTDQRERYSLIN